MREFPDRELCPFCGDDDPLVQADSSGGRVDYYVECGSCRAQGPVASSDEEAIRLWNRNVDDQIDRDWQRLRRVFGNWG